MNTYSTLLRNAASEMRTFAPTAGGRCFSPEWLETLAIRFDHASGMSESAVGREVETLSHILADSGTLSSQSAPSFGVVMDAHQRAKKRQVKG